MRSNHRRSDWASLVTVVLLILAGPAFAQEDPASEAAASDELFDDAESFEPDDPAGDGLAEEDLAEGEFAEDTLPTDRVRHEGLETLTVTAQKRRQTLQEVPAAVTAISGGQLDEAGFTQMQDIASIVPNMHFGQETGSAKITIRGISNAQGTDQSTAFHMDGIYQNSAKAITSLTFFDVERIEVLRGPQGTLYGRNATGGAINVLSNGPSEDFELFGDVQFANYWQQLLRGVINVPLVEDLAAVRLSGYYENRNGYQKNFYFEGDDYDADDAKDWGLRGQLKLTPFDSLEMTLRGTYLKRGGVGYAVKRNGPLPAAVNLPVIGAQPIYAAATPNPTNDRHVYYDVAHFDDDNDPNTPDEQLYPWIDNTLASGNADILWAVPRIPFVGETKLRVLGSYQQFDSASISDQDYSDLFIAYLDDRETTREWVAEVNWSSDEDRRYGWLLGLFYLGGDGDRDVFAPALLEISQGLPTPQTFPLTVDQDFSGDLQSVAGFVNAWYDLTDELKLEAGFRYSHDWKGQTLRSDEVVIPNPLFPIPPTILLFAAIDDPRKDDWGRPTGSVSLNYQFTDESLLYGRFATGYKSGAINNDIAALGGAVIVPPNAGLEDIYSLEIGMKNTLLENRLFANATIFQYWYDDLQVSQIFDAQNIIQNAASAQIFGIEAELTYRPVDALTFITQFAYLDSIYTSYSNCIDAKDPNFDPNAPDAPDCTGNELSRAPRFSGTFITTYEFDLDRFGTVTPFAQIYASDKVYFRPTNDPDDTQDAYFLLNFRLMWQSQGGRLGVDLFLDNALDEDVATTKAVGSALLGAPLLSSYDRPRTVGIRLNLAL